MRVLVTVSIVLLCLFCFVEAANVYTVKGYNTDKVLISKQVTVNDYLNPTTIPRDTVEIHGNYIEKIASVTNLVDLTKINIKDSVALHLFSNWLNNLPRLQTVTITKCKSLGLQTGTFQKIPAGDIVLRYNNIQKLNDGTFIDMPFLEYVSFSFNDIEQWNPNTFLSTPNMKKLDLDYNKLTTLPSHAFKNIPKIKELTLLNNKIKTLPEDAFLDLNYMETLDLGWNLIEELPENLLAPFYVENGFPSKIHKKRQIDKINISVNRLTYVPEKLLQDIIYTSTMDIQLNPFICACYKKITRWAYTNNVTLNPYESICLNAKDAICIATEPTCIEKTNPKAIQQYFESLRPNCEFS